ncbi:MAG: MBL fold metallo-hydrolase [Sphaerochaeta sp.]
MATEITTLIENTLGEHLGLHTEHGLSFLVETEDSTIIFDSGQSDAFLENATKLHKDLSKVNHVVLSHGHYDHSGGFRSFVETFPASKFTLWTGKGFFEGKYAKFNASYQYLGNDFDETYLLKHHIPHQTVLEKQEIAKGVWAVTKFDKVHLQETIHPRFVLHQNGEWIKDDFSDEVLLVLESAKGLIVLVGCAHPGILNMLSTVKRLFNQNIYALLGGTHLVEADEVRVNETIRQFSEERIEVLGISHCSGMPSIELATKASHIHFHNCTGSSLILEG